MEEDSQNTAINLSTVKDGKENLPNGDVNKLSESENGESSQGQQIPEPEAIKSSSNTGALKRKTKTANGNVVDQSPAAGITVQQPLQAIASQHGLSPKQIQQLFQQQHQPALNTQQLQQMMQQQAAVMQHQQQQKMQERVLQQLNEQLQVNIIQQSQLMQQPAEKIKTSSKQVQHQLQQLALQQQQLVQQIQQIQLQQRQYLLACLVQPFGVPQGMMMNPAEIQQLWKEVSSLQPGMEDNLKSVNGVTLPTSQSSANIPSPILPGPNLSYGANGALYGYLLPFKTEESPNNPLYRHSLCKWPDCDTPCESYSSFLKHLNAEHQLDDRSTAQTRVQIQLVSQLEVHLAKEKELLQAMMQHLHMNQQKSPPVVPAPVKTEHVTPSVTMAAHPPPLILPSSSTMPLIGVHPTSISQPATPKSQPPSKPPTPTSAGPMRRRVSDKCNLPISAEIQRNREFYKNTDVRPPFTYASLIRQAIIESPHKQLTLNEIYQWFQNTFAYFRRNEATWKNAVRHNLSLHKCFMRVENVKGAVWTVDEVEFYKRRPQKLSGALSLKSPTMAADPAFFGDNINASFRAAMEQTNMALMNHHMSNGSVNMDGAEDLSMKSYSEENSRQMSPSMLVLRVFSREEILLAIKQESDHECGSEVVREEVVSNGRLVDEARVSSQEEQCPEMEDEFETEAMDMTTSSLSPPQESESRSPTGQSESMGINLTTNQELYSAALLANNGAATHSIVS
ncbi:hypothetical protein ScPMuIL_007416 [Solemya velum]